ncbi:hypothetical protein PGB90_001038 [Kerria lacca]
MSWPTPFWYGNIFKLTILYIAVRFCCGHVLKNMPSCFRKRRQKKIASIL